MYIRYDDDDDDATEPSLFDSPGWTIALGMGAFALTILLIQVFSK